MVADAWIKNATKPTWIIFAENQSAQLVGLMREAIALLPEKMRWKATFSTYCTNLPPDVDCKIRCVVAGSDEARMSIARGDVIDLTKKLGSPPDTPAVVAARLGKAIGDGQKAPAPKPEPIRPVPSSATNYTGHDSPYGNASSIENAEEYELQEDSLFRPAPTPQKLPPRPLVQPKHLKAPKPINAKAEAISPIWFVGGIGALIVVLLLAVTLVMVLRPKTPDSEQMAIGQNGQPANTDDAVTSSPEADLTPAPATTTDSETIVPPAVVIAPAGPTKLVCEPADASVALKDLRSTLLARLKLEGNAGQDLDPQKVKILRNGQEFTSISIQADGGVVWQGDNPALTTEEATLSVEITYDVGKTQPLEAAFRLKVLAGENPDIAFTIRQQTDFGHVRALGIGSRANSRVQL